MKKELDCPHPEKHCYTYNIISGEINLCEKCENKMRSQIFEQDKIEKEVEEWILKVNESKNKQKRVTIPKEVN